jgi:long-chain acyl-CoA synthetase
MPKNFRAWPEQWPRSLNYPEEPIYSFLDHTAARVPNRLAIIFGGMELTFGELKNLADRFANGLASMGVEKGERVAIHLPNCPQFAIAYYGALKAGCIFTPLSPLLAPKEARYQLNDSGAGTLITLDLLYPGIAQIIPETKVERVITTSIADCYNPIIAPLKPLGKIPVPDTMEMTALLKEHPPEAPRVQIDVYNDLAHLAYTGGTTGLSKGVMLTHRNVLVNAIQFSNWPSGAQIEMRDGIPTPVFPPGVNPLRDRVTARDREVALVVVPWFHAMGTIGYLNGLVYGGTTMVVFPRFDPKEYLDGIQKYRATALGGAPQLFIPLVNLPGFDAYDLSSIKYVASGAAPLPLSILEKMLQSFSGAVCEGYGLTECTMGATCNRPHRTKIRPGSVGLPVFDTECKVVDPQTGEDLPVGQEGEICIRGPQVMKGYWNKPEETARDLKDGWLYTGDIGREDEEGFFYITDRKKDLIIYKGYNVYPRELEEVLFQHPAVEQCAVVGRADMAAGEAPVAFVQLRKGATASKETLLNHTNPQVAAYKKLRDLIFLDAIPVSPAGKVLKRELRDRLKQGSSPDEKT